MIIGSHVSLKAPDYLLGAIEETISYNANALMIYTGAPQNTIRKPISQFKLDEAKSLMNQYNIDIKNLVVHAPYIINLANKVNPRTREIALEFLEKEINRVIEIGAFYLVIHPGSHVSQTKEEGIQAIIEALNLVVKKEHNIMILLETMAGKGTEIGRTFEEIKYILENVENPDKYGVCLDTCHINDAGYDLTKFDDVLDEFDRLIGIERIKVVHVNDSKNPMGAQKDRHENIGKGTIGFDILYSIVHNERLKHTIKILETPWVDNKPPYKEEIALLKAAKN